MAINLLPKHLQVEKIKNTQKVIFNAVSVVILVLLIVTVAVLFSYRVVVTRNYNELTTKLNEYEDQVNAKENEEWYLIQVHNKLADAKTFLGTRLDYGSITEQFKTLAGDLNILTDVQIDKENHVTISGESGSLTDLALYLKALNAEESWVKNIKVDTLKLNSQNFYYTWSIILDIQQDETK